MAGAVRRIDDPARWRTPALIAASLAVHAALLGPLAFRALAPLEDSGSDRSEAFYIPLDLEPRFLTTHETTPARPTEHPIEARIPAVPTQAADAIAGESDDAATDDDDAPLPPPVAAGSTASTTEIDRSAGPAIDGRWAVEVPPGVMRGLRPGGRLDCRDLIVLSPMDRAICEQRFETAAVRSEAGRIGERRLTRTESIREDGFAQQAAANRAWSDYRRGNGDEPYPGLISLLKQF